MKNKLLLRSIATSLFTLLTLFSLGQNPARSWEELMQDPSVNIYEVREEFNKAWAGKEIVKGRGYKQYKRWENFMDQRCFPSGDRFAPDAVWKAMQDKPEMYQQNNELNQQNQQPGSWAYIGNTSVPTGGGGAGRVNGIRNLPGSSTTLFACAPAGGLWKTTNSGTSWTMLGTDYLSSIGCTDIAIDPTNTNIMYLATGDGDHGDTYSLGVLKSTDGGLNWTSTGLNWTVQQVRTMNRIIVHPINTQIVVVATSDGLYRSTNGGTSWTQELGGNIRDCEFKPGTPATVYCVANDDDFYRSTDTGDNWSQITTGLPTSGVQRMSIAVSPANSNYVYILASNNADSGLFGIYRSTDSGANWTQRADASPNYLTWDEFGSGAGGQGWYDLSLEVDGSNAEIAYLGGVNMWKTSDGGTNWSCVGHWYGASGIPYVHADVHCLHWIPGTTHLLVGCDGGVFRTTNGGSAFSDLSSNLPIAQQYRLGTAATDANKVLTGWQDNGTNYKDGANWSRPLGGDGMECIIDPTNANTMYGTIYYGTIFKTTTGPGGFFTIVNSNGAAGTVDEGGEWVTPFVLGSASSSHIYVGKSRVYKSTNGGSSFSALGGMGGGNINQLAVAPSNNNYIYASKYGTLYKSTDGNNFAALGGLPGYYITAIAVHSSDPNKVWVTFSNFDATYKVYYTTDGGNTWTNLSVGLPNIPANSVVYQTGTSHGIYVGTDAGVFYRDDSTGGWLPFNVGMPNVVVTELEIHYGSGNIVAATFGRGLWSSPLYSGGGGGNVCVNLTVTGGSFPSEIGWNIGGVSGGAPFTGQVCVPAGCQAFNMTDSFGDGWNGATFTFTDLGGNLLATGTLGGGSGGSANVGIGVPVGCTDPAACNYDAAACSDNGSCCYQNCVYLNVTGGSFPSEIGWSIDAYSGSAPFYGLLCLPAGCLTFSMTDSFGDSWNGGTFTFTDYFGNVLSTGTHAGGSASAASVGVGVPVGCTDPSACNYDAAACSNNGTCCYSNCITLTVTGGSFPSEISWSIGAYSGGAPYTGVLCLPDGCYTLLMNDAFGDDWNGGTYTFTDSFGNVIATGSHAGGPSSSTPIGINVASGCNDPAACNYNAGACMNDGSCCYQNCVTLDIAGGNFPSEIGWSIEGYSGSAPFNGMLCLPAGCLVFNMTDTFGDGWNGTIFTFTDQAGNVISTGTLAGGSAGSANAGVAVPVGCTDPAACNYDAAACSNNGSCCYQHCLTLEMFDSFGDGWDSGGYYSVTNSQGDVVLTSTLPGGTYGTNFWCLPDGCYSLFVGGSAFNSEMSWTLHGTNEGSLSGGAPTTTSFTVGIIIYGCTDPAACNYFWDATCEDGTCCYDNCITLDVAGGSFPSEIGWNIAGYSGGAPFSGMLCLPAGCLTFNMTDSFGDSWNGGAFTFTDQGGNVISTGSHPGGANSSAGVGVAVPVGCIDPAACNYDAAACSDNGTCCYQNCLSFEMFDSFGDGWDNGTYTVTNSLGVQVLSGTLAGGTFGIAGLCLATGCYTLTVDGSSFNSEISWNLFGANEGTLNGFAPNTISFSVGATTVGCMDPGAVNYNPSANCAGVCNYCTGDFDNNGVVNTSDLLLLMANFGCPGSCGIYDLDGNGVVNTGDLLLFMAVFGTICP